MKNNAVESTQGTDAFLGWQCFQHSRGRCLKLGDYIMAELGKRI